MFETDKVLMTQKSRTWSLKLTTVERKMFGNYTCVATNSLGTQQDTTTLTGQFQFFQSLESVVLVRDPLLPINQELVQTSAPAQLNETFLFLSCNNRLQ